jgi:hypothetical protein
LTYRFRRLTLRSATGMARRAIPTLNIRIIAFLKRRANLIA